MHVNANIYRLSINQHENASVSATEHKSACKCDYTNASMPATEHKSASKREHAKTEYKSACCGSSSAKVFSFSNSTCIRNWIGYVKLVYTYRDEVNMLM